jgi:4-amino-4-deoxy-L-arabinose transferase-like glycosyltransferase
MRLKSASIWIWPALGLLIAVIVAWWVRAPGYMDADYYFANARQIADGGGLQEPFLWNYLDDPTGLPHPSFAYWMPLASLVSAASMAIAGAGFRAAQAPFVLATAVVPALTAAVASRISSDKAAVRQAAALAIFPGFFLPFFVTTDSFSIYMLVGAGAMLVMALTAQGGRRIGWLAAGILVGFAHLTRADGMLLLIPGLVAVWPNERRATSVSLLFAGYLAVMLPWWVRDWYALGSPFSSGLNRTFWLLRYDELFSFPASILTPQRWWAAGLGPILMTRLDSLLANIQTLVAVNGLVFLGPFMLIGALERRSDLLVRLNAVYLLLLLGVMSLVFPFAGARGGFFHSSTALMPLLWSLAPLGIRRAVSWAAERRRWAVESARSLFGWSAPALAGVLTLGLLWTRVVGMSPASSAWGEASDAYAQVGQILGSLDPTRSVVASNNPPGMYLASGAPSVMIPNGPPETLRAVIERYDVRWVVLDANRPEGLASLYLAPDSVPWLALERRIEGLPGGDILILEVTERVGEG